MLRLLNTSEGPSCWLRKSFLSKENKGEFHLKREVHATCPCLTRRTIHELQQFHYSEVTLVQQTKILQMFSPITHKVKVFISSP